MKTIIAAPQYSQSKIDFRMGQFLHTLQSVHELAEIDEMKTARDRLVIALDVSTRAEAIELALKLAPFAAWMKIGLQLFTAEGPDLIRAIRDTGAKVFLDVKLYDIPNTVGKAVESAARLEVNMLTLHLSGGTEMIRAGVAAAAGRLSLIGVTVLTSSDDETLRQTGVAGDVMQQVMRLATLGEHCKIDGLVASAEEVVNLRKTVSPNLKLVVPGIRPRGSDRNEQKRTATPGEAVLAGADYLVIGRPITRATDPAAVAQEILKDLQN